MEFGISGGDRNTSDKLYGFYGINKTRKGSLGEMADMKNMSADEFPCASPRKGRKSVVTCENVINAVTAPDYTNTESVLGITGVSGGGFYYNGVLKSGKRKLSGEWSWEIVRMGNLYVINGYGSSEKKSELYYYNIDTDEFAEGGSVMDNLIVSSGTNNLGNYLKLINKSDYGVYDYSVTLEDGTIVNNSDCFRKYAPDKRNMSTTENVFAEYFKVGDEVTIEGFPNAYENPGQIWAIYANDHIIQQKHRSGQYNNTVDTDNMPVTTNVDKWAVCTAYVKGFEITKGYQYVYFDLYNKDGEEVEFSDLMADTTNLGDYFCSGVTLRSRRRVFDHIAAHNGRIWGTSPSGNVIYASASDKIFSFTSTDIDKKFAVRLNSDTPGTFTGLCPFNNELVAFKADSVNVISGTGVINYTLNALQGVGCIAPKSIVPTSEGIVFLSYNGFCIFSGSVPKRISDKLNTVYTDAVAGFDGDSYYASAVRCDGGCELMVYDMRYGIWYKYDDMRAVGFFRFKDGFYVADKTCIYSTDGSHDEVDWRFTLMKSYDNSLGKKGINEIWVMAEVGDGAEFCVETAVDGGAAVRHTTEMKTGLNVFRFPVRLAVGENLSVSVSGKGKVVIYELEMIKTDGGRRFKAYEGR